LTVSFISPHFRKYFRRRPRAGLVPTFEEFLQFVSATIPLNMTAALRKQRRINNHWKPVYLNCAPCSQPYQIIVKMETFDQDVAYIRRRLGLAQLDNSKSSQVGQLLAALSSSHKGGHHLSSSLSVDQLSADLSSIHHVGQKSADRPSQSAVVEAFRALDSKLVERIYQIYEPDFLLFGYSPQKYVNVAQNETNKQIE
jgi:hypothetical protein